MNYLVVAGLDHAIVPEEIARAQYDATVPELRTGEREGAFILWGLDRNGWRTIPTIYKPTEQEITDAA